MSDAILSIRGLTKAYASGTVALRLSASSPSERPPSA